MSDFDIIENILIHRNIKYTFKEKAGLCNNGQLQAIIIGDSDNCVELGFFKDTDALVFISPRQYSNSNIYTKVYVDKKEKRWINVDRFGAKDTITLRTESGKLITRTCQYWQMFFIPNLRESRPKCKISYKGRYMFVKEDTVLED